MPEKKKPKTSLCWAKTLKDWEEVSCFERVAMLP
jgi:hypothetical protein